MFTFYILAAVLFSIVFGYFIAEENEGRVSAEVIACALIAGLFWPIGVGAMLLDLISWWKQRRGK